MNSDMTETPSSELFRLILSKYVVQQVYDIYVVSAVRTVSVLQVIAYAL
jgi:hypothetical protein